MNTEKKWKFNKTGMQIANISFCPEKLGPLGRVRVFRLCLNNRCKSVK